MEKNSYKIDNDLLTIRTLCGEFSFKVDDSDSTANIHRIAEMMVSEMANAEESVSKTGVPVNPHVLVLLANLNLSKKYVELRDRLDTLKQTLENKTRTLGETKPRVNTGQQVSGTPYVNTSPQPMTKSPLAHGVAGHQQKVNTPLSPPTADRHRPPAPEREKKEFTASPTVKTTNIPTPSKAPVSTREPESHTQATAEAKKHTPKREQAAPILPPAQKKAATAPDVAPNASTATSDRPMPGETSPESQIIPPEAMNDTPMKKKGIDDSMASPAPENDIPNSASAHQETDNEIPDAAMPPSEVTNEMPVCDEAKPSPEISNDPPQSNALPQNDLPDGKIPPAAPTDNSLDAPMSMPISANDDLSHTTVIDEAPADQDLDMPAPMQDSMQKSPKDSDDEIPQKTMADPIQQDTVPPPVITKTSVEEKTSPREPAPAMGSFPIHTATDYSHIKTDTPLPMDNLSAEETYQLPSLGFLKNINSKTEVDHESIRRDAELLEKKLGYFGIKGEVMGVSPGPVITTFEYKPDPGIKISKIVNLADDLALALSAYSIRIVAPIPGKDVMGIEIPNLKKSIVPFIDIVSSEDFINNPSKLPICLGKDIIGNPVVVQLESMPHLLIAGATGTGKSVGLNAMITSILYKAKPDEVKFLMIDPKRIELSLYNDIPHLITPVITDMKKATTALQWMVREMERRYDLLAKYQVRNIEQFNQKMKELEHDPEADNPLSYIVIIIDELADLMMTASRDVELSLTRLAQMARAAGIHLILATQRPSVDVLTGIIKANFPTRISFQVSSKTDSRTIIDSNGAETLLGMGDMLFVPPGTARLTRVHGTYLSEEELIDVTTFLKAQQAPEYLFDVITEQPEEQEQENIDDEYDEKYQDALEVVMTTRQASISGIQRALRVGYNRAARIIDIMERKGIVGPSDGAKPRQVLTGPMD